jgi:predicted helicase
LHYLYAVVHSPTYRARYAAALKVDFPRVPMPGNASLFAALGRVGADLVGLHLLEEDYAEASWKQRRGQSPWAGVRPRVCGNGMPVVARGYPRYTDQRVYLNANAWIDEVPENVWAFQVGGYTVCAKWLKDRQGRVLSAADIAHYRRIVRAFAETIRLMGAVDRVIDEHGGWPGAFRKN